MWCVFRPSRRLLSLVYPCVYVMDLYFCTFVFAILVFAVRAGFSFYEVFQKLRAPHPLENVYVNYLVLGAAMIFEGIAWWIAFTTFRKTKGKRSYFRAVRRSKDPTVFTVLFEDSAAMLGLVVAFVGIALGEALDMPVLDGEIGRAHV